MSASSITTDKASALAHMDAIDAIVQGWVTSYLLQGGATTTANGAGFATDGGNAAAGSLLLRLQTTLRSVQAINHG